MKRHLIKSTVQPQNLDSFLDILTNTVGVLMFIGLFVSLVSVEAGSTIRTPIISSTNKRDYNFEIHENRVLDFDVNRQAVESELAKLSLQDCQMPHQKPQLPPDITQDNARHHMTKAEINRYNAEVVRYNKEIDEFSNCMKKNGDELKDFTVKTLNYDVTSNPDSLTLSFKPEIRNSSSIKERPYRFLGMLNKLNPNEQYIVFYVRPDSFSEFREARKMAWDMGFDVGWEPLTNDRELLPSALNSLGVRIEVLPQ